MTRGIRTAPKLSFRGRVVRRLCRIGLLGECVITSRQATNCEAKEARLKEKHSRAETEATFYREWANELTESYVKEGAGKVGNCRAADTSTSPDPGGEVSYNKTPAAELAKMAGWPGWVRTVLVSAVLYVVLWTAIDLLDTWDGYVAFGAASMIPLLNLAYSMGRRERKAKANRWATGDRVEVSLAGHRWNGVRGIISTSGGDTHLVETDEGREIGPLKSIELVKLRSDA